MLKHLHINNFAVIDNLEITFREGLTVLTGETGAGKSILIDALGLILGDRADSSVIRTGCDRTEISAEFYIQVSQELASILDEQSITIENNTLLIRRVINKDGRSRAYINTTSAPIQLLREIGEHLIDIHGQHAHQSLLKRDEQRDLLDGYGDYDDVLTQVDNTFDKWDNATKKLQSLTQSDGEFAAQLSLLKYQVEELAQLELTGNELAALDEEYKRLSNVNNLIESTRRALDDLYDNDSSVSGRISIIKREIADLEHIDSTLMAITELLENAEIQISEAVNELRAYHDNLEPDPAALHKTEQRLNILHDMGRKHHIQPQQLYGHFLSVSEKLAAMEQNQRRIAELKTQQAKALEEHERASIKLNELRRTCADGMAKSITREIRTLGMPESRFTISVDTLSDPKPHRHGGNQVEFQVSINPGQALRPLRKVASGGELSRISLAIQVLANQDRNIATMIFDEVDAGIGGGIAEIVGNLLWGLAKNRQIFCVTHLPQVAAQADNHFQVQKATDKKTTETHIHELDKDARVEEVARMLGGLKISEHTRNHAKEMLALKGASLSEN